LESLELTGEITAGNGFEPTTSGCNLNSAPWKYQTVLTFHLNSRYSSGDLVESQVFVNLICYSLSHLI
jgi:hypothetical protein